MVLFVSWLFIAGLSFFHSFLLDPSAFAVAWAAPGLLFGGLLLYLELSPQKNIARYAAYATLFFFLLLGGLSLWWPQLLVNLPTLFFSQPAFSDVREDRYAQGAGVGLLLWTFFQLPAFSAFWILYASLLSFFFAQQTRSLRGQFHSTLAQLDREASRALHYQKANTLLQERAEWEQHEVRLQERNRIAREIHDNVGHKLTAALLQTSALELSDPASAVPLAQIHETLDAAMREIRQSVHGLYDQSLTIEPSMRQIIENYQFCPVQFDAHIKEEPPAALHFALLAILREALANTARHSNATLVQVHLAQSADFYHLLIADNGTKIAPPLMAQNHRTSDSTSGMGLYSMQERAESLGGTFSTHQNQGFHIFVRIPAPDTTKQVSDLKS